MGHRELQISEFGNGDCLMEVDGVDSRASRFGKAVLARTMFELEDTGPKFRDLAEFLKNTDLLEGNTCDSLSERSQPIMAFVTEIQRLCSHDTPLLSPIAETLPDPSPAPRYSHSLKRKDREDLLPPSPEKTMAKNNGSASQIGKVGHWNEMLSTSADTMPPPFIS
ncbi:hypothetical protein DFH07DRAFT_777752 [Mycena maculata]|uniref:Uncharacterized protein n=1 Tax=Mycena maculata TaxID=230809 RepID=A0AAD7IG50_9AGAR|nr:hypothetical protein DFH07DRAFT_777752 [Mycena maculata]